MQPQQPEDLRHSGTADPLALADHGVRQGWVLVQHSPVLDGPVEQRRCSGCGRITQLKRVVGKVGLESLPVAAAPEGQCPNWIGGKRLFAFSVEFGEPN